MRTAIRRTLIVLVLVAVPAGVWMAVDGGRYLQHEDPLRHADAVFVLGGSRLERPMEAVDLYRAGYAGVIVLSPGRPEVIEVEIRARGITFPRESEIVRGAMVQLGVPATAIILTDSIVDNTAAEAVLLRSLVVQHGWHTVIVVTSKYHTRRAGFALRRTLRGTGAEIIMRATRYDSSDPAHWLQNRSDFRFASSEWQKLIAYRLGLAE